MTKDIVLNKFKEHFGEATPEVYTSPGRVNLIGEHTITTEALFFQEQLTGIAAIRLNGTDKICSRLDLDENQSSIERRGFTKEGYKYIFVCAEKSLKEVAK